MTRRPRIVIPGWVHHVTQRGNHRQKVFYSDHDRIVYLKLLGEYGPKKRFNAAEWKEYLERMKGEETLFKTIRNATMRGLFLGKEETALRLERELGNQLLPRKRGRKPGHS
jgi:putative transposase